MLIASKPDYREDCAGMIIKRDGDEQRGTFPQWKRLLPESLNGWTPFEINRNRIKELLKQIKVEKRLDSNSRYKAIRIFTGVFIRIEDCKYLLQLPDEGKFYIKTNSAIVYHSNDGNYIAIIMPDSVDEENYEMELIPEY